MILGEENRCETEQKVYCDDIIGFAARIPKVQRGKQNETRFEQIKHFQCSNFNQRTNTTH